MSARREGPSPFGEGKREGRDEREPEESGKGRFEDDGHGGDGET